MLKISQSGTIQLTRGDTARFSVDVENELTNQPYEIQENDIVKLTVKKKAEDEEALIEKVVKGSTDFHIEPLDTKHLPIGKYEYDVEINTAAGDVYTVVECSTFQLTKEVG